jgi:hypothetical protein
MKNYRKAARIIITAVAVVIILYLLQKLLVPKYVDGIVEGALVAEYYEEQRKDFDVVFVGDCEVYENFSPVKLWEEYGINSYIRGSAEQYIWQSYYLIEDTLRYEKPKAVVFNIQSLQFNESQSEAYNRMTLEGMKWSMSKVKSIKASMTENEHFIEYVFPLLRYHTRWSELTEDDIRYMFNTKKISHNGYYMRVDVKPVADVPTGRMLSDYSFGDNAWSYLDKMVELCKENDIELILIKAPSLYPYWYPQWDEQVKEYADNRGLTYINFLDLQEETGIDYNTDTYDAGLHMNLSGAEKLSVYLGNYIVNNIDIPDHSDDSQLVQLWNEKISLYNEEIEYQKELYNITE